MNANASTPNKTNPRPNHIKTVSSVFRFLFIVLLVFYGSITLVSWFGAVQQLNEDKTQALLNSGTIVSTFVWFVIEIARFIRFWMAYKLFTGFTTNGWFSSNSTKWLRRIGFVSLTIWLLDLLVYMPLAWSQLGFDHIQYLPAMQQLRQYVGFALVCVKFNTDLLTACLFIFMAWIMDEGRKIQEEQELTV